TIEEMKKRKPSGFICPRLEQDEKDYQYILKSNKILDVKKQIDNIFGYSFEEKMNLHPSLERHYKYMSFKETGETIFLDLYSRTINYNDNPAELIILIDITEQMIAEYRLRESEQKYRLITENANDMIIVFNERFEIEYINELVHKIILGYSKDELIGKNRLDFVHPDDFENMLKIQEAWFTSGEENAEMRLRKKNGDYIWVQTRGKMFINVFKKKNFILILRDITENKKAAKIIEDDNLKLKELNELRKELYARANHEIMKPLNSLGYALKLLIDMNEDRNTENFEQLLNDAYDQILRLNDLTVNLLEYTMLEVDKFHLKKDTINASHIILKCVNNERIRAKKRGIMISCNLPNELWIYGDEMRMTQVFQNVLSNAINYTPKDKNGKISIYSEIENRTAIISIKDNGIGMTQDDINKLFIWGSNIRKDYDNIIKGSGIGLSITRQIIHAHGGEIWAESKGKEQGSTFKIELPIKS
ncbi:MAG: PAS domain S-box protein, partial [Promethearchaeota archaeon]